MKTRIQNSNLIALLSLVAVVFAIGRFVFAAEQKQARVTEVIHDVRLLAAQAAARPATVNDNVGPGAAVRTGSDSRAELTFTDRTLTRLGANTVFSFGEGARDFDLASGSVLLYVPKRSGKGRINTAVATVAGTSFTAMAEYHPKSWLKFIVLEGHGSVSLNHHPGETRKLRAGQMIVVPAGVTKLAEPQEVDLSKLIKTSLLITKFPALPNVKMIFDRSQQSTDFAAE